MVVDPKPISLGLAVHPKLPGTILHKGPVQSSKAPPSPNQSYSLIQIAAAQSTHTPPTHTPGPSFSAQKLFPHVSKKVLVKELCTPPAPTPKALFL